MNNVLQLGGPAKSNKPIITYTDANWASERATERRSTSGSLTFIYGSLVSWKLHVQKCVSLLAVEAEFVAASEATRESLFFKYLLREMGITETKPLLLTDSPGSTQVSKDPAKHWKLQNIGNSSTLTRGTILCGVKCKRNLCESLTSVQRKIWRTCSQSQCQK